MGCTPSHSDIANHHAKHGTKSLNQGILPVDPGGEGFSLPLLIKSSSSYDTEEFCPGETQVKDHFFENSSDEDKNFNFRSSSEDPLLPELDLEEKEIERTVSETEIAISELTEPDKYVAGDIKVKKQKSSASEKNGFNLEDKNEIHEKQNPKKGKKQKNSRQGKQARLCKMKEKSSPCVCEAEKKVDFPELLVKAHQNAYAYLNPNLSKYEVILCMANQATETQLIMQQMVSFLLLRFDEINHLLEEIAQDGEDLVKEVGGNLAWPAGKGNPNEQPDLLQQLLQYTVNKMQALNGTVASLTSDALQESCSFLQSAGSNLEEKLKAKQGFDERLLRMIKLLEASAVRPSHPHPDDMTLYSEDSGIGIDTESVKDLNLIDKQGIQGNVDSCSHAHSSLNQTRVSGENHWPCTSVFATSRSHDCALERQFKDIFYPPAHTKDVMSSSQVVPEDVTNLLHHQNIIKTPFLNSVHSDVAHEGDCFKDCESPHASSTYEDSDDDNSLSEEEGDNISLSEKGNDALPKRPTSLPEATDGKQRPSTKRIDSPENEEIILKMKDAISEKIKFVPTKSGKREWMEEENGKGSRRPSTATGSQKTQVKQKRSRSEESLKSQNEDPTLLELQRTQKGLNKRLEMFYTLNGNKETNDKLVFLNLKEPSNLQDCEHVTHRYSTNKLKASLAKNFNILPNQDKAPLFNHDQNAISQQPNERKCKKAVTTTPSSKDLTSRKENEPPRTQKLNSVGCVPPRKSVKKLIETFSPPESVLKPTSLRTLGPIKCIRKFGLPSITPSLPFPRGLVPLNHKHRVSPLGDINCRNINPAKSTFGAIGSPVLASGSDTNEETDDDDLENLPPPPPEMLMDISLDSTTSSEGVRIEENYSEVAKNTAKRNENGNTKKISHRMKASLCSINLLPSKNLNTPNLIANKASKTDGMNSTSRNYPLELSAYHQGNPLASQRDRGTEETEDLYKQSHKIIPLQNPKETSEENENDPGNKECVTPPALAQKRYSPDSLQKNEKTTGCVRRVSIARTSPSSPPREKRLPSSPLHHRHINQASLPSTHWQPSPPANARAPSPPTQRKLSSPPTQQNLSSPPMTRKQQSPPTRRKVSSPPTHRKEANPSAPSMTPSPPTSPSRLHKGLQKLLDSGDEQQPGSLKIISNARSIFCPATSSLFEAKPMLPPNSSTTEAVVGQPEVSAFARRNSTQLKQYGDQQRRMAFSATNPQPFVRRSFSDRRPGFPLPLPLFSAAGSEPVLSQTSMEDSPRKEGDCWNSPCFAEGKGAGKSFSHPELYIVGQGLHKD
ncbi:photoreceptor cilium actin regulator [Elgaria multicarinata webbii]|uniref:photoreceptor cilium actin regulator n=1 Tax=Elgaria multicarinata webbii TaxID=159646 RepID=UPI002FCD1758